MNLKEAYIKIYLTVYEECMNYNINEPTYIITLQNLCRKGFKPYHIDNFLSIIDKFIAKNMINAYNISYLINLREIKFKFILDASAVFMQCNKIMYAKRRTMIMKINSFLIYCKRNLKLMNSFEKLDIPDKCINNQNNHYATKQNILTNVNITSNEMSNILVRKQEYMKLLTDEPELLETNDDTKIDDLTPCHEQYTNIIDNIVRSYSDKEPITKNRYNMRAIWEEQFRIDILERLHLLAYTHYTIHELASMGVKLIYMSELKIMHIDDLYTYYIASINTIRDFFANFTNICLEYTTIETNYLECCKQINNNQLSVLFPTIDANHTR